MRLLTLIVAFNLTAALPAYATDYAQAPNHIGGVTVLTDQPCKFDKSLPEAYTTDAKGDKTLACYWFGKDIIYFEPTDSIVRFLPKKDFVLIKNII